MALLFAEGFDPGLAATLTGEVEFRLTDAIMPYEQFCEECEAAIVADLQRLGAPPYGHLVWRETLKEFTLARVEYTYTTSAPEPASSTAH